MARPGAWPAFAWKAGRIHLSLPEGHDPRRARVMVNALAPPPREWGIWKATNVWVEASHLRFEGLRFDFGVGSSLHLWNADDVAVVDCAFSGADVGVNASGGVRATAGLRVERCLFENYPQGEWSREWLSSKEVYAFFSRSRLVACANGGTFIRGNLVVHGGDGMAVTTGENPLVRGTVVSGNLIAYCTDDAIEFDGFARDIRFEGNLVYDCHESLGVSPVLAGPVIIERNLFLHPHGGLNGAQVKLMNPWANRRPPHNGRIRNVAIRRNAFVGNWLCWTDGRPVEDVLVAGNHFSVQHQAEPPWPAGVVESRNLYETLPEGGYPNPGTDRRRLVDPVTGEPWRMRRPGPAWLDWSSIPATRRLASDLSEDIFEP